MLEGGGGCCSHSGERGPPLRMAGKASLQGLSKRQTQQNEGGQVGLQRFRLGSKVNSGTCPVMGQVKAKWVPAVSRGSTGRLGETWSKE